MKKLDWKAIVSMIALVALTLACSSLSLPNVPVTGGDKAILRDDFSNSSSGWGTGTDSSSSVEYVDSGLKFTVFSNFYITWSNPDTNDYQNIHIDVTTRNESPDELAIFGVVCHEQATQSFYYLGVAADGYYTISKSQVGQDDVSFTNGTSDVIPPSSEPFTIGADCGNGNLALYVNGQQIASAQDSSFTTGKVGLFAWTDEQANGANVTFDDFVMTSLE